ncbi:MAG: site-specific DNA-methyltransferase [Rhodobacteraceae bacterium]|nr:site-specific DNA-methyltransferase [Paracoccaceae bacterium]
MSDLLYSSLNTSHSFICGDVQETLKSFNADTFDLVIADPPYNIIINQETKLPGNHGLETMGGAWKIFGEHWDKLDFSSYLKFTLDYLAEVKRVVKPSGSIWIFGTYHNIGTVNICMRLLEIEIINEVIWYKSNAFPNLANRRLTASHETILWAHKGNEKSRKYFFDVDYAKSVGPNEDALKIQGKQMRTVWSTPNNKKRHELTLGSYPAQKPLKILKKMIQLSTKPKDRVLSLFAGSGSDACAAIETERNSLSVENDKGAVKHLKHRISDVYGIKVDDAST